MPATAMAERMSLIRERIGDDGHVSLTDFARGRGWRDKLSSHGVMELRDRGERAAWIVSDEGMAGIVDYISELEEQVERAAVKAMVESRRGYDDWAGGDELAEGAVRYLDARSESLLAELSR